MRLFALLTILPAALALPTDPFVENLGRITPMEMLLIRIGLKDPIMPQCASKFSRCHEGAEGEWNKCCPDAPVCAWCNGDSDWSTICHTNACTS
ncbi:hypothetical protein G7Y79_00025g057180 [Physcia stellaris]|nr:hypothetical protein G7Y79_00025g057180 [Physcia stellaris]